MFVMRSSYKFVMIAAILALLADPAVATTCFAACAHTAGTSGVAAAVRSQYCVSTSNAERQEKPDLHLAIVSSQGVLISTPLVALRDPLFVEFHQRGASPQDLQALFCTLLI